MADPLSGSAGRFIDNSEKQPYAYPDRMLGEMPKGLGVPRAPATSHAPIHARIAELAKELTDAAYQVAETRQTHAAVAQARFDAEARFRSAEQALQAATAELREGTPEGVPYARER